MVAQTAGPPNPQNVCRKLSDHLRQASRTASWTAPCEAMVQINELSASLDALKINQMTRWVMTKEEHAGKIVSLMSEYSLCQRVKPMSDPKTPFSSEEDYTEALKAHHMVMAAAVKTKQTVDPANADALEAAIDLCCKMYLPAK